MKTIRYLLTKFSTKYFIILCVVFKCDNKRLQQAEKKKKYKIESRNTDFQTFRVYTIVIKQTRPPVLPFPRYLN